MANKRKVAELVRGDTKVCTDEVAYVYLVKLSVTTKMLENFYNIEDDDDWCAKEHKRKFETFKRDDSVDTFSSLESAKAEARRLFVDGIVSVLKNLEYKYGQSCIGYGNQFKLLDNINNIGGDEDDEEDEEDEEDQWYEIDPEVAVSKVSWEAYWSDENLSFAKTFSFKGKDLGYDFRPICQADVKASIDKKRLLK